MESEEYEQIPWSKLVAEVQPSVDRRLYVVGGAVAAVVILIFALRMFGSSSPTPMAAPVEQEVDVVATQAPIEAVEPEPVVEPPAAVGAVTEADLMAVDPDGDIAGSEVAEFVAEWFVTDFYTRDGSQETLTSLQSMMAESIATDLPHVDPDATDAFVEWARAFRIEDHGATVDVSVAYRSVHAVDGGYVRDPVEAVIVSLTNLDDRWIVHSLPRITDLP